MSGDLLLSLPKYTIGGWTSIRVTRGMERCPNDFEIALTESFPGAASEVVVQPGDPCSVKIGKDLVLTGYVDRVMPSYNRGQHEVVVSGRGKCQDIVDCSALWEGNQIANSDIKAVAQKLAAPYGIEVHTLPGQDTGYPIPLLNFGLGETAYGLIEALCRWRQFLIYELPDGSLTLQRVSTKRAASGFKEGDNVEYAQVMRSMDQRFSKYESYMNSIDVFRDVGDGGNLLAPILDDGVPRFRHKYVHVEAPPAYGLDAMLSRARWEANRRIGRSFQVHIQTDSWRDSAGNLYEPNTVVSVELPGLKVAKQDMVIGDVTYTLDGSGTHCDLILMPPSAFDVQPAGFPGWLDVVPINTGTKP